MSTNIVEQPQDPNPKIVVGEGVSPDLSVDPEAVADTMRALGTSEEAIASTTVYIGGKSNVSRRGFQINKSMDRSIHGSLERNEGGGTVIRVNTTLRGKTLSDESMNNTLVHELEHNAQADRNDPRVKLGNLAIISLLGVGFLTGNRLGRKTSNKAVEMAATLAGGIAGLNAGYVLAPHEIQARKRAKTTKTQAIHTKK